MIVSPLYDIGDDKDGTHRLVDAIVKYAHENGQEEDRLEILTFDPSWRFEPKNDTYGDGYNRVLAQYFQEAAGLVESLRKYCRHLFIGNQHDIRLYSYFSGTGDEKKYDGALNFFLREKGLEFDVTNLRLVGHGSHKGACVEGTLKILVEAIRSRHEIEVPYTENRETTKD